jgi:hypothetical protein
MLAVVKGVLVTTGCHGRRDSSHSAVIGRPCCSQRAAQRSAAQWIWDLVVRLAKPAKLVSTLRVVGADTRTRRSGAVYVRAFEAYMALPFLWRLVRHGSFSDGRTERRVFDALA